MAVFPYRLLFLVSVLVPTLPTATVAITNLLSPPAVGAKPPLAPAVSRVQPLVPAASLHTLAPAPLLLIALPAPLPRTAFGAVRVNKSRILHVSLLEVVPKAP